MAKKAKRASATNVVRFPIELTRLPEAASMRVLRPQSDKPGFNLVGGAAGLVDIEGCVPLPLALELMEVVRRHEAAQREQVA